MSIRLLKTIVSGPILPSATSDLRFLKFTFLIFSPYLNVTISRFNKEISKSYSIVLMNRIESSIEQPLKF